MPPPPPAGRERGPRWPAKWAAFRALAVVAPRSRRLLLVASATGVQAQLGAVEVEVLTGETVPAANLVEGAEQQAASAVVSSAAARREAASASGACAMHKWLSSANGAGNGASLAADGGSGGA